MLAATARADAPASIFAGAGIFVDNPGNAGWALDRVHPVLGVYRQYAAANYVPLLAGLGTRGFSVFLADQATAADYAALAPLAAVTAG